MRRGPVGMGWADHWDESFLLKNDKRRLEVRDYLRVWPSNRLKSNKLLILSNQMYAQFE